MSRILLGVIVSVAVLRGSPASLVGTELTGSAKSGGRALAGVAVSARLGDGAITTTVFTDERGQFAFPSLAKGRYSVWAQAVGYEASRAELPIEPGRQTRHDFSLSARRDFSSQLSTAEWLASLPDQAPADRRLKHLFDNTCNSCHQGNFVLQNRFDEAGWQAIIDRMSITDHYASEKGRLDPIIAHYRNELAAYLARVRGPSDTPLTYKLLPRPQGDTARVVITEYSISPAETPDAFVDQDGSNWSEGVPGSGNGARGVHDVAVDRQGNAWVTDGEANRIRSFFKVDATTGEVHNFRVPAPNGFARGTHGVDVDAQGIVWINAFPGPGTSGRGPGSLVRVDPSTNTMALFSPEPGKGSVGMTVEVDHRGKVWAVSQSGATAFDPVTKQFTLFKSLTAGVGGYGVAGDRDGNGWWVTPGKDVVGFGNFETGAIEEIPLEARPGMKELATPDDVAFFPQASSNAGTAILPAQGPRRMSAGPDAVWWANFWGHSVAKADYATHKVTTYPSPIPDAHPYDVAVDKFGNVWTALMTDDRVAKLDPKTGKWTVYMLPSLGSELRHIAVDNFKDAPEVWAPSYRNSKVARLQFR